MGPLVYHVPCWFSGGRSDVNSVNPHWPLSMSGHPTVDCWAHIMPQPLRLWRWEPEVSAFTSPSSFTCCKTRLAVFGELTQFGSSSLFISMEYGLIPSFSFIPRRVKSDTYKVAFTREWKLHLPVRSLWPHRKDHSHFFQQRHWALSPCS